MNFWIFFLHVFAVLSLTLTALRLGKESLIVWLSLLAIASNLFVSKQIVLFGGIVTCSDALAVGFLVGLTLLQEFFGQRMAQKAIWISFFIAVSFLVLLQIHLFYEPATSDRSHSHFLALFQSTPRLVFASLFTFWFVQKMDSSVFAFLREKWKGKFFPLRSFCSVFLSQALDTLLFSTLGLLGEIDSLVSVMAFSFLVKLLVLLLSMPFVALSKKMVGYETFSV